MLSMNQGPGGSKTSTPAGSLNAVASESTTRSHRLPSPDRPAAVTPPTALTRDEDIVRDDDGQTPQNEMSILSGQVTHAEPRSPSQQLPLAGTTANSSQESSNTPAMPIPGATLPPVSSPSLPSHGDIDPWKDLIMTAETCEASRGSGQAPEVLPFLGSHLLPGHRLAAEGANQSSGLPTRLHSRAHSEPSHNTAIQHPDTSTSLPWSWSEHPRASSCSRVDSIDRDELRPGQSPDADHGGYTVVSGPLSRSSLGIGSGNSSDDSRHLSENYARATSESSGAASDEDRIAYRNKRQFPPLFPTHLGNNSSSRRGRSIQTNRIAAWFTQHEKFHSPVRQPNPPEDLTEESRDGASQSSSDLSQSEVELLWRQLKEKRAQVEEIRGKMSRMRVELRGMRRLRDEAENSFMTAIRPLVVLGTVPPAALALVDSQMDEMRKSREAYHFVESRYEDSERDLDTREEDLDNLEIRFFSLLSMVPSTSEGHASAPVQGGHLDRTTALAEDMPYELLGIVGEKALEDVHPLYDALSSRVGDLSNAEEEYQDLMHARDECEEERSLGEKTGQAVSSHAKRFLAELPSEERKLRASVARIEEEVNKLKRLCQQKGVMKKHMAIKMAWKLDRTIAYDDMELQSTTEILRNHSSLTHARTPTLLSCPNHLLESPEPLTARQYLRAATRLPDSNPKKTVRKQLAAKELEIEMLSLEPEPGSSGISVNKWLLHQLRTSRIQVMLHRWVSEPICGPTVQVDTLQWEHEVLYFWFRDNIKATDLKFSPSTANETERSYRRGTPQLSKAASEGRSAAKRHLWIKVKGSEVRSVT